MKDIFDLGNETIVSVDRKLRLVITWKQPNVFQLYIIDLKNRLNELDTSKSSPDMHLDKASKFAEDWLNEIRSEIWITSTDVSQDRI